MRKVKYTAENFSERLNEWINGFPRLNDIHPFYADWLNVLYDKDHYKIALGQLRQVAQVIEKIAMEHIKFLKFADSAFRCK